MHRRLSVRLLHGIEPFEFDARIRCTELPIDGADSLVAFHGPAAVLGNLNHPSLFELGQVVYEAIRGSESFWNRFKVFGALTSGFCGQDMLHRPSDGSQMCVTWLPMRNYADSK